MKLIIKKFIDDSYDIHIKPGISQIIPLRLKKRPLGNKYAIITDATVEKLHGKKFRHGFQKEKINAISIVIKSGERSKSLKMAGMICKKLLQAGFDRKDCIIALGGGVVGDLAGFVASIYMRGIPYIHVPTTLLAMTDSSIGGKTGVNLDLGKNMLGTFYQPKAVYIDPCFLSTLLPQELKNGMAEVIKHSIICDRALFEYLEKNIDQALKLEKKVITTILNKSCRIKSKIITKDEKESEMRMILNYGHTFGHAIERLMQYRIPHGYAISIGMCLVNEIAVKKRLLVKSEAIRIKNLFKRASLPTELRKNLKFVKVLEASRNDKKHKGSIRQYIVAREIGKAEIMANLR